jgi:hypothetical protein
MKFKKNVTEKTICIGSFIDTEIQNQFQYVGKKGSVYMFYIDSVDDNGIHLKNPVTNEFMTVNSAAIKKMKSLDGDVVSIESFDSVIRMEIIDAILSDGEYNCYTSNLEPIKIVGMATINKNTKFYIDDENTFPIEEMYKSVSVDTFG